MRNTWPVANMVRTRINCSGSYLSRYVKTSSIPTSTSRVNPKNRNMISDPGTRRQNSPRRTTAHPGHVDRTSSNPHHSNTPLSLNGDSVPAPSRTVAVRSVHSAAVATTRCDSRALGLGRGAVAVERFIPGYRASLSSASGRHLSRGALEDLGGVGRSGQRCGVLPMMR